VTVPNTERNVVASAFVEAVKVLKPLTPEQRAQVIEEVLKAFCEHCGEEHGILTAPHRCSCFDALEAEPVHLSVAPFEAACGADAPNQRTTTARENVTCARCLGSHE
jgi:hypothetical protein